MTNDKPKNPEPDDVYYSGVEDETPTTEADIEWLEQYESLDDADDTVDGAE